VRDNGETGNGEFGGKELRDAYVLRRNQLLLTLFGCFKYIYIIPFEFWSFNWLFMVTWYWIENSISQECDGIYSIALFASAIVLYVYSIALFVFLRNSIRQNASHTNLLVGEKWNVPFNSAVASLNGTFHLSPHENILTIALINIHYLYTNIYK
jgi:hypothetical protein